MILESDYPADRCNFASQSYASKTKTTVNLHALLQRMIESWII